MESKLTCPECEGTGLIKVPYPVTYGFGVADNVCPVCNETGDLLKAPMHEPVARAILKAARDKCGGKVEEGGGAMFWTVGISITMPERWRVIVDSATATEFAFTDPNHAEAFLKEPRVTESLDFIFRPKG